MRLDRRGPGGCLQPAKKPASKHNRPQPARTSAFAALRSLGVHAFPTPLRQHTDKGHHRMSSATPLRRNSSLTWSWCAPRSWRHRPTTTSRGDLFRRAIGSPSISIRPGRLPSDVNAMFDLVGLGAAIENACIAARQQGFEPSVEYSSAPLGCHPGWRRAGRPNHIPPGRAARSALPALGDPLHLPQTLFDQAGRRGLLAATCGSGCAVRRRQLDWIVEREQIREFSRMIAVSDRFRFEYEPFHNEIFRQLRFSAEEAERTRDGLDVRTLELPPGAAFILRRLRPWSRMRWIQRLGLVGLLTLPSILSVRKSGAIGVLSVPEADGAAVAPRRSGVPADLACRPGGRALAPAVGKPADLHRPDGAVSRAEPDAENTVGQLQLRHALHELLPSTAERVVLIAFRLGIPHPPIRGRCGDYRRAC